MISSILSNLFLCDLFPEFNPLQYIPEEMYGISGHFNNLVNKYFCFSTITKFFTTLKFFHPKLYFY